MGVKIIITAVAIALLALHWRGRNAVWGGATLGIIVGFIFGFVTKDWGLLLLFFTAGTFIGTFFEWLGRIANKLFRKEG
ncbi:hypothetical protein ACFL2I_07065 [Candidatus Omnitrophota bacterium]